MMKVIVPSPICVRLFATPWMAASQASLSLTISRSLPKFMSIELVMPSNHLILCHSLRPQSFPASKSFPMSQFFASGGQSIGDSNSAWDLPMNIQDWFPLGWTGWISLQSKGLSRVFFNFMAPVTICSDFGAQEKSFSLFPLFPHLFAMKWWDRMPWS